MEKISIIIPAHNEEKRIVETLEKNIEFFKKLKKNKILDFEIIVVVNGSKDKTIDIVKRFSKKYNEIKYLNLKRGAKGYAVIEGFKEALKGKSELIGFKDADMATTPESFYDLINNIGEYDGIIASRYIKCSKVYPKPTIQRIIVSRIYNWFIKLVLFLNYKDTQCGAKLFKRDALEKVIPLLSFSLLAFDVDIIYHMKKKGFKIKEISTTWADKEYSQVNFMKSGPWMVLAIIRLRLINSPFKFIVGIYDKFLTKIWRIKK